MRIYLRLSQFSMNQVPPSYFVEFSVLILLYMCKWRFFFKCICFKPNIHLCGHN